MGDRDLLLNAIDKQLKTLVLFHLRERTSGKTFSRRFMKIIFGSGSKESCSADIKSEESDDADFLRLKYFLEIFRLLKEYASALLPIRHANLGELTGVEGFVINTSCFGYKGRLSECTLYPKVHIGFDLNRLIPDNLHIAPGKRTDIPFFKALLSEGETVVMDRGYQCHQSFDDWQRSNMRFICQIKKGTRKSIVKERHVRPNSIVFLDARALLGISGIDQTTMPLRVIGYESNHQRHFLATDVYDLSSEFIAKAHKLRNEMDLFFLWWKKRLRVYPYSAETADGLILYILSGLVTYLLLSIYYLRNKRKPFSGSRITEISTRMATDLAGKSVEDFCGKLTNGKLWPA